MQKKGHHQSSLASRSRAEEGSQALLAQNGSNKPPDRILSTVTEDGISYESGPLIHEPFKATEHLGTRHVYRFQTPVKSLSVYTNI